MCRFIAISTLLLSTLAVGQTLPCAQRLLAESFTFAEAYDLFSAAPSPAAHSLSGKYFRLTGVINARQGGIGVGSSYDATGYTVVSQTGKAQVPAFRVRAKESGLQIEVENWGARSGEMAPEPFFPAEDWGDFFAESKLGSRTFSVPLFGEHAEMFAQPADQVRGERAQLFCRESDRALICMVEYWRSASGVAMHEDRIEAFLVFQAVP